MKVEDFLKKLGYDDFDYIDENTRIYFETPIFGGADFRKEYINLSDLLKMPKGYFESVGNKIIHVRNYCRGIEVNLNDDLISRVKREF
ncbi:MAG: hypothetical protein ACRCZK_01815 [Oscillospiraceae bacterium]